MRLCAIEDCQNDARARGMCDKHYRRWAKNGSPLVVKRISGPMPFKERFEMQYEPVTESGCWLWIGNVGASGYGRIKVGRKTTAAHRASYEFHYGPVPEGMFVCHKCDTPSCVNPNHLFVGTPKDNTADAVRKGRHPAAETHNKAKLTWEQAEEIRISEEDARVVARRIGVSFSTIYRVRQGVLWNANQRKGNV